MRLLLIIIPLLMVSCSEEKVRPVVTSNGPDGEIPVNESWNSKKIYYTHFNKG